MSKAIPLSAWIAGAALLAGVLTTGISAALNLSNTDTVHAEKIERIEADHAEMKQQDKEMAKTLSEIRESIIKMEVLFGLNKLEVVHTGN